MTGRRDGSVGRVTRLRAGGPRNRGSISDRGKRPSSCTKGSDRLRDPPCLPIKLATGGSFHGTNATGTWSWPLTSHKVSRLKKREAIPPLPHIFLACCLIEHWYNFTRHNSYLKLFQTRVIINLFFGYLTAKVSFKGDRKIIYSGNVGKWNEATVAHQRVLSQHWPGETEENGEKPTRWPGIDSNRVPPECVTPTSVSSVILCILLWRSAMETIMLTSTLDVALS
jgi:hypothetical protein